MRHEKRSSSGFVVGQMRWSLWLLFLLSVLHVLLSQVRSLGHLSWSSVNDIEFLFTSTATNTDDVPHVLTEQSKERVCGTNFSMLHLPSVTLQAWYQQGIPVLGSAIWNPSTQETFLIFTKKGWGQTKQQQQQQVQGGGGGQQQTAAALYRKYHGKTHWKCNGLPARVVGPPGMPRDRLFLLILACPGSKKSNDGSADEPLHNVSFANNKNESFSYTNLSDWWTCQTRYHPLTRRLETMTSKSYQNTSATSTQSPSIKVMGTIVKGDWSQALLPQWTAHHRLAMGIDHFIVYVNEDWDTFKSRSSFFEDLDHRITYVPFDLSIGVPHYFQRLHQNDLLYRIRAAGSLQETLSIDDFQTQYTPVTTLAASMEWLGILDVDEFLYIPRSTSKTGSSAAQFNALLQRKKEKYPDLVGLQMANVFYGSNTTSGLEPSEISAVQPLHPSRAVWLCKYTWRRSILPISQFWQRQKIVVQPHHPNLLYVNVHHVLTQKSSNGKTIASPKAGVYALDPVKELHHAHFKQPDLGPFQEMPQSSMYTDWGAMVEDTGLRDDHCEAVVSAVEAIRTQ